jgi:alanyl-tRNA synthetase
MESNLIRNKFLEFFEKKGHKIVPSAPMVIKNDPTLMFTNAGMNPFKDFFLGNKAIEHSKVADTQKCLRVSGKHNDLEEVGLDSYHHTMFEMLGNWSFGDYFKEEAIAMAWELMTDVFEIDPNLLYVTVFEGDANDQIQEDEEAKQYWMKYLPDSQILYGNKKDNFWEMGDQGPCGPCSEIHIDIRDPEERNKIPGASLVNKDHPQVIEIWNLVFIEFNRKANGSLEDLPAKHIDTGMGLERLSMVLQNKKSNYETDIFKDYIQKVEEITQKKYLNNYHPDAKSDIAFRVIADHLRAVAFGIADGELPSNSGAGYVLRRILRRAVRYYYSFLGYSKPLMYRLVSLLAEKNQDIFPDLKEQKDFIEKVIREEENSFLHTLSEGLQRLELIFENSKKISGAQAFELYDTFGFPIDLTRLIAEEQDVGVDLDGFEKELIKQRERSRADSARSLSDWTEITDSNSPSSFEGYDLLMIEGAKLLRYRQVEDKSGLKYQLVFDKTPFYAESGGQVGDQGNISWSGGEINVLDTIKENDLILHITEKVPPKSVESFDLVVDASRRSNTENNHSATHLLHAALRNILGDHVVQRGSLVTPDYLRFDFSHFEKLSQEDLINIEKLVNSKIREDIKLNERRSVPLEIAKSSGAMMLFGEKYDETVRIISFNDSFSQELCGGCHVASTGKIGYFKIVSESAVASGVRRIEAKTGAASEDLIQAGFFELDSLAKILKSKENIVQHVQDLINQNKRLQKELEQIKAKAAAGKAGELKSQVRELNGINFLIEKVTLGDSKQLKSMLFDLEKQLGPAVVVLAADMGSKAQIGIIISKSVLADNEWSAGELVKEWAPFIRGGGGGQNFFAMAGGSDPEGLDQVLDTAKDYFKTN